MKRVGAAILVAVFTTLLISSSAAAAPTSNYPPKPPSVTVDDNTPDPGQDVIVSGTNWCPGSTVEIFFDGKSVGTATVGPDGTFSTSITIPDGTTAGEHTITVKGLDSTCDSSQVESLTVSILGGGTAQGNLPFTGSNLTVGMLLLAALVIVGAASVLAGRRRKAHPEK